MSKKYTFPMGGIHPEKYKLTANCPIEDAGLPETVCIPVKQHIGSSAKILVNKGDKVKVGTLIADADGIVSSDVHSSVSGEVLKVEDVAGSTGYEEKMITIKVEGEKSLKKFALPVSSVWVVQVIRPRLKHQSPKVKKLIS